MADNSSIVVGDDLGVVRCLNMPITRCWGDAVVSASDGTMCKEQAVQCMASHLKDSDSGAEPSDLVAAGRVDGSVTVHAAPSCRTVATFKAASANAGGVAALCWLPRASAERASLLAAHADGNVVLHRHGEDEWSTAAVAQCAAQLQCCDLHSGGQLLATGGDGSMPCVHDLQTGEICCDLERGLLPNFAVRTGALRNTTWRTMRKCACLASGAEPNTVQIHLSILAAAGAC